MKQETHYPCNMKCPAVNYRPIKDECTMHSPITNQNTSAQTKFQSNKGLISIYLLGQLDLRSLMHTDISNQAFYFKPESDTATSSCLHNQLPRPA